MFAARPFLLLNIAPAAQAGVAVRAITSTTITTIKGWPSPVRRAPSPGPDEPGDNSLDPALFSHW